MRPDAVFAALLDLDGRTVFSERATLASSDPRSVRTQVLKLRDAAIGRPAGFADKLLGAGVVLPGPFGTGAVSANGFGVAELAGHRS